MPEDLTAALVREVVDRIRTRRASGRPSWTTAEIGRTARAVRLRRAPEHERVARRRAWADRKVQVFPDRNGMATLHAVLDATDAHRIHRRLSAIAQGLADPERTRDQVRADILVDVLLARADGTRTTTTTTTTTTTATAATASPVPGREAVPVGTGGAAAVERDAAGAGSVGDALPGRPEINVTVSLATLLGLADDPADVPGLGPISPEVARALAADGTWRIWVTDAINGAVISTGSRTYVPSAGLARLVRAREPECRMPGCRRSAERCDLDHTVPWPEGPTSASNLGPLCRRHHILKTHANWSLEPCPEEAGPSDTRGSPANQGWTWHTPAGFTIHDSAEPALA